MCSHRSILWTHDQNHPLPPPCLVWSFLSHFSTHPMWTFSNLASPSVHWVSHFSSCPTFHFLPRCHFLHVSQWRISCFFSSSSLESNQTNMIGRWSEVVVYIDRIQWKPKQWKNVTVYFMWGTRYILCDHIIIQYVPAEVLVSGLLVGCLCLLFLSSPGFSKQFPMILIYGRYLKLYKQRHKFI